MMETILNLIWLGITIAVICLWRFRWTVKRRNAIHPVRLQGVALLCFVALLFPVISLTDDLHPEIMVVDAIGGKRSSCLLVAGSPYARSWVSNSGSHVAMATPPSAFAPGALAAAEAIPAIEIHIPNSFPESFAGRSPPALL